MSAHAPHLQENDTIPGRLVIGVTGHRELENAHALAERVRGTLHEIHRLMKKKFPHTPVVFTVLSPLAEGADRLVASEVLKTSEEAELEVVLPLPKEDYEHDFDRDSREKFEKLLEKARHVRALRGAGARPEAYAVVGRYVVDHCDVLIALWNGKPAAGVGGTAEIVEYARHRRRPIFCIDTTVPERKAVFEHGRGLHFRGFVEAEEYNVEPVDPAEVARHMKRLRKAADHVHFPVHDLLAIAESILPNYARADVLALRYQRRHLRAGSAVYYLAAAAVCVAAFQALFFPQWPIIVALEAALMVIVSLLLLIGRWSHWHEKWMDYRFLAECFRSALFLALAGVQVDRLSPPPHLSLAYSTRDWIVGALLHSWRRLPRRGADDTNWRRLREFLVEAWVEDQILYHQSASTRNRNRHRRRANLGLVLFLATIVMAVLHASKFGEALDGWLHAAQRSPNGEIHLGDPILSLFAVALPAIGGAVGAIRTHREFLKNARRSEEMARYLSELRDQMLEAPTPQSFRKIVREVEEAMLHENQDWRVIVRFHELELPA